MKIKSLLTKTLLVAAGLCVGASNAWAVEVTETYDFLSWAGSGDATITASLTKVTNASSIELTVGTAIGANSLNSRFAFCNISSGTSFGWRLRKDARSGYGYQYGLYTQGVSPNWGPFYWSICNLKNGDKVTITWQKKSGKDADPKFVSTNAKQGETTVTAGAVMASGTEYTITADGHLDLVQNDNNCAIKTVVIKTTGSEAIDSNPTVSVTGANNGDRTITIVGPKTNADNATVTYYTKNGTTPTSAGTLYSTPFTVTASDKVDGKVTIKAITYKNGDTSIASEVSELVLNDVGTTLTLNAPVIKWNSFTKNGLFYNPTYTFSQDQSSIIGSPAATMEYKFAEGEYTEGTSYTATATGRLTVKVSAAGYTSAETYIDIAEAKYAQAYTADFSTLTVGDDTGNTSQTFNNAGCNFYEFENSFSDKVTLSGFSLAKKISAPADVQGIFARGGDGTITYKGEFPSNSAIYFSCASRTAWYSLVATTNTQNIAQYNGVYNMTVYVPTDDISIAIANCKAYETSDAFATAIAGQSFTSADEVYAFHTSWQIAQADAASSNDITKVILNAAVASTDNWSGATVLSGEKYTGAPDNYYLDKNTTAMTATQTVYGLPAGTYTVKVATRASASLTTIENLNVYAFDGTNTTKVIGNHIGNSGGTLGNGWGWTILSFTLENEADVSFGFYCNTNKGSLWASCDDWHLYKGTLSESKSMTSAGWATFCSPYPLDFSNSIANLTKAYTITGASGSTLTLSEITGTIPANTGILLEGTEGTITIPVAASNETDVSSNKLVGVTSETAGVAAGIYVLMKGGSGVGFYQTTNAFTVGANTAYLPSAFAGAREFFLFTETTTGINKVESGKLNVEGYYNLNGQRVAQPTKGLYIVNGKKVVVK